MLKKVEALATLPVTDIDRAREFYEKIGLKTVREEDMMVIMKVEGGPNILLYERDEPTKADHTVLTFEVKGLEKELKELEKLGVEFEDYDLPDLKTENHIARMENDLAAWFKDSEGNIIGLHEEL